MNHILVLGAGYSTSYLIKYLLDHSQEHDWFVTVGDRTVERARQAVVGHARGQAVPFEANDSSVRSALIAKSSVVVNMLTRPYQYPIALDCVTNGVHMLSASYEDSKVRSLDPDAVKKNVLILNEMGLDPGIDHMVAMSMIQRIRSQGGVVNSFRSYGGSLPAPETTTNPLRYAITWNPRNVLMAGEDGALYKEEGKIKLLPFHQVFDRTWTVDIEGIGTFEAYPNRDSLSYKADLGLEQEHTIIRGTLRYPGWSETWAQIVRLGLANEMLRIPNLSSMTYRDLTEMCLPQSEGRTRLEQQVASYLGLSPTGRIMENLKFLGIFSKDRIGVEADTVAEAMIHLIAQKLRMPEGGRDLVILHHDVEATFPDRGGVRERHTSTMIEYGEPGGATAISRTVGLPVAVAVRLLLTGRLPLTGCQIPTHAAVYKPVLEELKNAGLAMREATTPISA